MSQCPRCIKGRVLPATDEWGGADSHCYACGYCVVPEWTDDALARVSKQLEQDKRTRSAQRASLGSR